MFFKDYSAYPLLDGAKGDELPLGYAFSGTYGMDGLSRVNKVYVKFNKSNDMQVHMLDDNYTTKDGYRIHRAIDITNTIPKQYLWQIRTKKHGSFKVGKAHLWF